ncbi:MAG: monovalent cation/H(+) antiporter subunit G [Euryarchaeota archaeon]|nr:monovalent cation/H(+) antiporter subunit G [Euryarchaeota archaeon]
MIDSVIYILLGIGVFFNGLGSFGLIRFPDVYTRLHAATKCTTFGSIFTSFGVVIYGLHQWHMGSTPYGVLAIHAVVALLALVITNPTGAHAIARAAHKSGILPKKAVVDELEGDKND